MGAFNFNFLGQTLYLLPERAIFWEEQSALIVSDLHLGKASHFRKAGVPVPSNIHIKELFILDELIAWHIPKQIIFLGDLFHSDINREWEMFYSWSNHYHDLKKVLVRGNHDILAVQVYKNSGLEIVDYLKIEPFVFTHEKVDLKNLDQCNVSGHIHPGISMTGKGKQKVKLPCFLFARNYALLPAFGQFTGLAKVRPSKKENVFVIADNEVIHVT